MIAVAQLASDVQLRARDLRSGDSLSDTALVAVHLRSVDVTVAKLKRQTDDLRRLGSVFVRGSAVRRNAQSAKP